MDKKLLAEVRFQFAQSVFNHSIQEMAANRKERYARHFTWMQLCMTFIVIIVLAIQATGHNETWVNILGIVAAAADLMFIVMNLTFGYSKQVAQHRVAAYKYLSLRGRYFSLITDIMAETKKTALLYEKRDSLNETYRLLADSPNASSEDYAAAQKALNTDGDENEEQYTWSDKEIDRFLPEELRLVKRARPKI